VREGRSKSKFLCAPDEQQWLVAGIPESATDGAARHAKEILKPAQVLNAPSGKSLRPISKGFPQPAPTDKLSHMKPFAQGRLEVSP
jgi:hypothetical protein